MSRALVLGGGGPVGVGWEAGLIVGLGSAGVNLAEADAVVGTSAGSVVGAQLSLGLSLEDAPSLLVRAGRPANGAGAAQEGAGAGSPGEPDAVARGLAALMGVMAKEENWEKGEDGLRAELGRLSVSSPTMSEDRFLAMFAPFEGRPWPAPFSCTAVDTATGEPVVWDASSGVDLARGIASSCSVPAVYPAVTIKGRRYMDGGMRNGLNAHVALGHDRVVAVSCTSLSLPEGMSDPTFARMAARLDADLAALRQAGSEVVVVSPSPEFLELSGWGLHLMDPSRVEGAFELGRGQGKAEAHQLASLWVS